MKGRLYKEVKQVNGGIRNDIPDEAMPDVSWELILNMEYDRTGALTMRGGLTAFNAAALTCNSIDNGTRFYRETTGSLGTVVAVHGATTNSVWLAIDATGTFSQITGGATLTKDAPMCFAAMKDYLLMQNGSDTMQAYQTGTTKATCVFSDNDIKGKYMAVADNKLHVAGVSTTPNRLWISGDGLFTTTPSTDCSFPSNNFVDIPNARNDKITGLIEWNDDVYVFRFGDVKRLYGQDSATWGMATVINDAGAVGQKAICKTPYGILFVSSTTIWWWNPDTDDLKDIGNLGADVIGSAVLDYACATYHAATRRIRISFRETSASTYNDYGATFDILGGQLTFNTVGATAFVDYSGPTDTGVMYSLRATTSTGKGIMDAMDSGTQDNSTNFTCTLRTKHFDLDTPNHVKWFRQLWINMNAAIATTPMTATAILDKGAMQVSLPAYTVNGFKKWGELVYGVDVYGGGTYQHGGTPFPSFINAHTVQIQLSKTDANAFTLYSYMLEYKMRMLRREN
jgi:hypothetical protein